MLGKLFNFISYQVHAETGRVDFDIVRKLAKTYKPKLIICGGSAYPRFIEFDLFKEVADEIGAFLMADIAHPAGLVATGLHPSPLPICDVVTTTTHKTLRGPRGGMIMMGKDRENSWGKIAPKSGRVKMISELKNSLKKASNDSARCVILTHESHVFSAGHDLKELKSFSKSETNHLFRECADLSLAIRNASFPVIAKLNGLATAVSDCERWFDCE